MYDAKRVIDRSFSQEPAIAFRLQGGFGPSHLHIEGGMYDTISFLF